MLLLLSLAVVGVVSRRVVTRVRVMSASIIPLAVGLPWIISSLDHSPFTFKGVVLRENLDMRNVAGTHHRI